MKKILFKTFLLIANLFNLISFYLFRTYRYFNQLAYTFKPNLCIDDKSCFDDSVVPYFKKTKMGQKLVSIATSNSPMFTNPEKIGTADFNPTKIRQSIKTLKPYEFSSRDLDQIPDFLKERENNE